MIYENNNRVINGLYNFLYNLKDKFSNYSYMILINSIFCMLIASYYIPDQLNNIKNTTEIVFLISMHISYMTTIALMISMFCLPIILLPMRILRMALPVLIAILLLALTIDTVIYADFHHHINIMNFMQALNEITINNIALLFALAGFIVIILLEYWLLNYKEHLPNISDKPQKYYWFFSIYAICIVITYASYALTTNEQQQNLNQINNYNLFLKIPVEKNK